MEKTDLKIRNPSEFDYNSICSSFSGEDVMICRIFFREWRREYFQQLHEMAKEDPVLKYLMKDITQR